MPATNHRRPVLTDAQLARITLAGINSHGVREFVVNLAWLPGLPWKPLGAAAVVRVLLPLLARQTLSERLGRGDRQRHQLGDLRIADDAFWIAALGDRIHFGEEPVADHRDAAVARAEQLLAAIGDRTLAD